MFLYKDTENYTDFGKVDEECLEIIPIFLMQLLLFIILILLYFHENMVMHLELLNNFALTAIIKVTKHFLCESTRHCNVKRI